MRKINIWEFNTRVSVRIKIDFLAKIKTMMYQKYRTKGNVFKKIKNRTKFSSKSFNNLLKESYHKKFFIPLDVWIHLCRLLGISRYELQDNIVAYKTSHGPNYISNPILPVKITPLFDMIIAHNIADGTVINPKRGRLAYFGYRQFDNLFRELYITKLEAIYGKINFPNKYYLTTTRPYCPPVLSSLFFKIYGLNAKSFLSKTARIPREILNKKKDHLLAVLIAFVIDEGNIDSSMIAILLKNSELAGDLFTICTKLGYKATLSVKGEYGRLSILRPGMRKFFSDYKKLKRVYPEMTLGKIESKIENTFRIYKRPIYKTKGNRDLILQMLQVEELTVNQIALRMNMTRQGVRFHVHNLEDSDLIRRSGFIGKKNIVYTHTG